MRNWLGAFRPASFRGVGFEVEYEEGQGGRRIAVSPIAYSDTHVTEDMGGEVRSFSLTAYVVGDAADAAAKRLMEAMSVFGPATLTLPMLGPKLVRCPSWRLSRDKRRAGYVAFDVEFVSAGRDTAPFALVPGALQIASLLSGAAALFGQSTRRAASTMRPADAAVAVVTISRRIETVARSTVTDRDLLATIVTQTEDLADLAQSPIINASAIGSTIASAIGQIEGTVEPFSQALNFRNPVEAVGAAAIAAGFCRALAAADYRSRQDARRARDRIAPAVDPLLDAITSDVSLHTMLSEAAATAGSTLSDIAANRAPLVRVETPVSQSATLLAYRLYADASRAAEIVDRNKVATPALMPIAFEALSA